MDNTETSTAQSQKGKEVFLSMVGYLGLKSEVVDKVSGKNIILSVTTDEPGRLIGRNGSALDSLGLLMNRILKKNDVNFPKVIVDVDGYDKKSNRRDKRKSSRDRQERPRRQEKEVAISEEVETSDDSINRYIDDETNTIKPVTTIAVGESDNKNDRRQNRRRGNRRNNDKNTTERNDRRRAPAKDNAEKAKPAVNAPADKAAAPAREKVAVVAAEKAPAAKVAAPVKEKVAEKAPAAKPQTSRVQMECRNVAKEVKRWGDSKMLPPQSDSECNKILDYFKNDKDLKAEIDTSRSYDDKKRVRVSLNK